ncbi:hypothetical protein JXJ21_04235 [candidate division KSB1 bacterium]|nr:hypothetical protein [candidate division KSB1 bacterium]
MISFKSILLLGVAMLLLSCSRPQSIYSENFESGDIAAWAPTDSAAWELLQEDGNTCYALKGKSNYQPPFRSPHSISLINNLIVTNFAMELDLKQTGRIYGHQDLCLFFGYQDSSHFYYVHLGRKADAHANSIFIVNEAPRLSIAKIRTDSTAWTTEWHHARLERDVASGDILVYFDDMKKPVMEATDKTFLWGKVGLGSFDDSGCFDNIQIWGELKAE